MRIMNKNIGIFVTERRYTGRYGMYLFENVYLPYLLGYTRCKFESKGKHVLRP